MKTVRPLAAVIALCAMIVAGVAIPQVALAGSKPTPPPVQIAGAEEDLGEPIPGKVLSPESSQGVDADGRPLAFWVTNGNDEIPGMFQVTDIDTKQVIFKQRVPSGVVSWANAFNEVDGRVYFAMTSGELYSWAPGDAEITSLGVPLAGEGIWRLAVAPDGMLYGGTYPGGRLLSYDPTTGTTKDLGQPNAGETYLRSIAVDDEYVYVGSQPNAKLARVDRSSSAVTDIPLPSDLTGQSAVYDQTIAGEFLFVRVEPSNTMLVYDNRSLELVNVVKKITGRVISQPDPSGRYVYFRMNNGVDPVGVYRYELATHKYEVTGFGPNAFPGSFAFTELADQQAYPGVSLVMTYYNGRIYSWNETTRKGIYIGEADLDATPNPVQTLESGPDGKIYVSGFLSPPGIAQYDPATGQYALLAGAGQVEGIGNLGDKLVMGRYPNADLFSFDTTAPWKNGTNPGQAVAIGSEQDRTHQLIAIDDHTVAVSSVPKSGRLGGAITLWDTTTGALTVHREPVPQQGVVSLVERDGVLYGGTTINGGYGIDPVATEAELFVFDAKTGSVTKRIVPVPGASAVNGLVFDGAGLLWGMADGRLFTYDVATAKVTRSEQLFPLQRTMYGAERELVFHEDGFLYAVSGGSLWRVDPVSWDTQRMASGRIAHITKGADGNLYYARNATLYRWNFAAVAGWDAATVYQAGDQVRYDGSVWRATWWTKGETPGRVSGAWQEIVTTSDGLAAWTKTRIFEKGEVVVHDGQQYEAKWWTRGDVPGTGQWGPWTPKR